MNQSACLGFNRKVLRHECRDIQVRWSSFAIVKSGDFQEALKSGIAEVTLAGSNIEAEAPKIRILHIQFRRRNKTSVSII